MIYSNSKSSTFKYTYHLILSVLFVFGSIFNTKAQIHYATSILSQSHVTNANKSIDADPTTYSELEAGTGAVLGMGAYSGYIELQFPSIVPADQTVYVHIKTDDAILSNLLSGTLANLMSSVSGVVLVGNQEFSVQVKDVSNTVVLSGSSANPSDFSGDRLKVVVDKDNNAYLLITPDQAFKSIKITTNVGSLLGLGSKRHMRVYDPYYYTNYSGCSNPKFTSYNGTGIGLDVLQLGGGVLNINRAIDQSLPSYSTLSLGVVSVASSLRQFVYFENLSLPSTNYAVRFKVNPALLNLGIGQNVHLKLKNGVTVISNQPIQNYLTPSNLTDLQNGLATTIIVSPGVPVDRVVIDFNGILGVTISQAFDLNEVYRITSPPTLNLANSDTLICEGTSANIVVDAVDSLNEIHWYATDSSTNVLHTNPSGGTYSSGLIYSDTVLWAASGIPGCPNTSNRIPINIDVIPGPSSSGLSSNVIGQYCASDTILVAVQNQNGTQFNWYDSLNAMTPIISGSAWGGGVYNVNNDTLILSNIPPGDTAFTLYVAYQDSATGCWNAPGNAYQIPITILDESVPTTTDSIQYFCMSDSPTVSSIEVTNGGSGNAINWYDENGNQLNASDPLMNSAFYYATSQGTLCESSDTLRVEISISPLPKPTTSDSIQYFCTMPSATLADIQVDQTSIIWYDGNGDSLNSNTYLTDSTTYYAALVSPTCESADRLAITAIFENPYDVNLVGDTSDICIMDTITYQVNSGMTSYDWVIIGGDIIAGGTSTDNTIQVVWNDYSGGALWVSYMTNNGCIIKTKNAIHISVNDCSKLSIKKTANKMHPMIGDQIEFTIQVVNYGTTDAYNTIVNEVLQSGFTYVSHTANYGNYDLNNGEWTINHLPVGDTAILKIKVKVNPKGVYTNVASINMKYSKYGVSVITSKVVITPRDFSVYNEISPNGDGRNDVFHVNNIESYPDNSLEIFNRYGTPVFKVKGYKNDWNGVANVSGVVNKGMPLPAGTYYYILKINKEDISTTGWIYIVR